MKRLWEICCASGRKHGVKNRYQRNVGRNRIPWDKSVRKNTGIRGHVRGGTIVEVPLVQLRL
jgi:hypothetical protein